MRKIQTNKMYYEQFDSVTDFVSHLKRAKSTSHFAGRESSQELGYESFYGTQSWEQAQEYMTHGYKPGLEGLKMADRTIDFRSKSERRVWRSSVVGCAPIVPKAIQGVPDAMMQRISVPAKQRVLNLVFDCSMPCDVTAEEMARAGRILMAVIKSTEASGIRINLTAALVTKAGDKVCGCGVKIKDAKANLNPSLISYAVTCPSFMRRHLFRWIEVTPATDSQEFARGYGHAITYIKQEAYAREIGLIGKNDLYIHMRNLMGESASASECIENINRTIAELKK